ncbi:hypothetical protein BC827DRAFT_1206968 [Russula dissimulans]|nr:hypothetical protein BC827DRAFT_1206968 [Russula dissimulans]
MFYTSQATCASIVTWTAIVLLGGFSTSATDSQASKTISSVLFTALCHPILHCHPPNTSKTASFSHPLMNLYMT